MGMYLIAEQNFNKRDPLIVEKNVYSVAIYHVGFIFQHLFWPVSNRYVLRIKRGDLRGLAPPNTVVDTHTTSATRPRTHADGRPAGSKLVNRHPRSGAREGPETPGRA